MTQGLICLPTLWSAWSAWSATAPSFEFMRRHGLGRAFAIDDDFADKGFETIP